MKILHTSDWHIGKVLRKHLLRDELQMFFDWLLDTIDREKIDLLLVSGDVFDITNPSSLDRQLYFGLLKRIVEKNIKIILTGGNHDSVGFLNAPSELLDQLNINIVAGACDQLDQELIPIYSDEHNLELIVAAVPYLRDKDIRNRETDKLYDNNAVEAVRAGIKNHYNALSQLATKNYPGIPIIAMGHLFATGSGISDSERNIHVGNAAAINANEFSQDFDYVALGHIHRPQRVGGREDIRYSGSPIALSFSEKKDQKIVLVLELLNGKLSEPKAIDVPKFRELRKFSGTLDSIEKELANYNPNFPLPSLVELEIIEEQHSTALLVDAEDLKQQYVDHDKFRILKSKTQFIHGSQDTSHLFVDGDQIEELKPQEVFKRKMEAEQIEEDMQVELMQTFEELLEMVQQSEAS